MNNKFDTVENYIEYLIKTFDAWYEYYAYTDSDDEPHIQKLEMLENILDILENDLKELK